MTATETTETAETHEPATAPAAIPDSPARALALWQIAVLALVAAVLLWPGQTTVPPVDRDETRYAQAASQMLETGDFIDIRLQEEPRYLQPAGVYWLQAASVSLFSELEAREIWAHRLPSYAAGILASVLTGLLGARLFGPSVGFLGGLLFASTVLLAVVSRLATTDAVLLVTILVAILGLHRAYCGRKDGRKLRWVWVVAFWAAIGAGILVKGPINPLVVGLTAGALCLLERRVGWLLALRPLAGLAIAAAIALPWYLAIYIESEGAFFQRSAGQNFFGKLFEGEQGHGFPPGYYLLVATATLWPASLPLALALPWIWRQRRNDAVRFCLAWAVPTWILYEIVVTKLPHYVLPTYPALCLLAAAAALALGRDMVAGGRWSRWFFLPFLGVWTIVGIVLAVWPTAIELVTDGEIAWAGLAVAAAGTGAVLAAAWAMRHAVPARALLLAPVATLIAVSLNLHLIIPRIDTIWFNREVAAVAETVAPCADYRVMAAPLDLESVVFLTRTDTVIENMTAIDAALRQETGCAVLFLEAAQEAELRDRLADTAIALTPVADRRVTGFNFSNGRTVDLAVFVVDAGGV